MRVLSSLMLLLACAVLCARADGTCLAELSVARRSDHFGSWVEGGTSYQIYDMIVTNKGTCALTLVGAAIARISSGYVSEEWNFDGSLITGFGSALGAGESFYGAGFVLASGDLQTLLLTHYECEASCYATTAAPVTTSAPSTASPSTATPSTSTPSTSTPSTSTPSTSTPSTAAPSTATPSTATPSTSAPSTSAPTSPQTTAAPTQCAVTAVVTRDEYSWLDQGRNTSVYRLTITNTGTCALKSYVTYFGVYHNTLLSYWNLQGTTGGFLVTGYGDSLAAGASYSAAGMVLAGAPDIINTYPYSSTCAC